MKNIIRYITIITIIIFSLFPIYAYTSTPSDGAVKSRTMDISIKENGEVEILELLVISNSTNNGEYHIPIHNKKVSNLKVSNSEYDMFQNVGRWDSKVINSFKWGKSGQEQVGNETYIKWGIQSSSLPQSYKIEYTLSDFIDKYKDDKVGFMMEIEGKYDIEDMKIRLRVPNSTCVKDVDIAVYGYGHQIDGCESIIDLFITEKVTQDKPLVFFISFNPGVIESSNELDITTNDLKQSIQVSRLKRNDKMSLREYIEDNISNPAFILSYKILYIFTSVLIPLLLIVLPFTLTLYIVYISDIKGKSKIECIESEKIKSYHREIIDTKYISSAYLLLKCVDGASLELDSMIKSYILILINKGVIKVIDKQKDLIFKLNECLESDNLTLEEKTIIGYFRLLIDEESCVEMSKIYDFIHNDTDKINKDILKIEKKLKKDLESNGYITVKLKIWKLRFGRNYYLTDKGKDLLNELIAFYNYFEDIHILNDKLVYNKDIWDNYMIWSTLYNKERTTRAYLKRTNSEYFNSTHLNIGYISVRM